MWKITPIALITIGFISMMGVAPVAGVDADEIELNPASVIYSTDVFCEHLGTNFTVDLEVTNVVDMAGLQFWLHYNTTLLQVVNFDWKSISEGGIMAEDAGRTDTNTSYAPILKQATVYGMATPTTTGSGVVGRVTFEIIYCPPQVVGEPTVDTTVSCALDLDEYWTYGSDSGAELISFGAITDGYYEYTTLGKVEPELYTLTIASTVGGTTNPTPGAYIHANGTSVNVTAIPDAGFSFHYWLLDTVNSTENPISVLMDANHTLEAFFVDDIPPQIESPTQDPPGYNVQPFQNVTVTVNVADQGTGVKNVTLWYSTDDGMEWTPLDMTEISTGTFQTMIPGNQNSTWVSYKISAFDNAQNNAINDNSGFDYKYQVIPEFPSAFILVLVITTLVAVLLSKKALSRKRRK